MTSELAIITLGDEVMELPPGSCRAEAHSFAALPLITLTLARLKLGVLP